MKDNSSKPLGYSKSGSKREVYSNTGLSQQARKIQINDLVSKGARENNKQTWNQQIK